MKIKLASSLALATLVGTTSASAISVSLELALLVDVSSSISPLEYGVQKDGYAAAFRNPELINAISKTPNGIAVTFVEWAGRRENDADIPPQQSIGWMHIFDGASSNAFADALDGLGGKPSGLGPFTNVGGALSFAVGLFANAYEGARNVIDISGDGPDNYNPSDDPPYPKTDFGATGALVRDVADSALGLGIDAINGLPIITPAVDFVDLEDWYATYVIGGTNADGTPAFNIVADGYEDIEPSILEKLKREIPPPSVPDTGATVALLGLGLLILGSVRRHIR